MEEEFWIGVLRLASRVDGMRGVWAEVVVSAVEMERRVSLREPGEKVDVNVEERMGENCGVYLLQEWPGYQRLGRGRHDHDGAGRMQPLAFAVVDSAQSQSVIVVKNPSHTEVCMTALDLTKLLGQEGSTAPVHRRPGTVYEVLRGAPGGEATSGTVGELFDGDEISRSHIVLTIKPRQRTLLLVRQREKLRHAREIFMDSFVRILQIASVEEAQSSHAIGKLAEVYLSQSLVSLLDILSNIVDSLGETDEALLVAAQSLELSMNWVEHTRGSGEWIHTLQSHIDILARRAMKTPILRVTQQWKHQQAMGRVVILVPDPSSALGTYLMSVAKELAGNGVDTVVIAFSDTKVEGTLLTCLNIQILCETAENCEVYVYRAHDRLELYTVHNRLFDFGNMCREKDAQVRAILIAQATLKTCKFANLAPSFLLSSGDAFSLVPALAKRNSEFSQLSGRCRFIHQLVAGTAEGFNDVGDVSDDLESLLRTPCKDLTRVALAYCDAACSISEEIRNITQDQCATLIQSKMRRVTGIVTITPGIPRKDLFAVGSVGRGNLSDAKLQIQRRCFDRRSVRPDIPLFVVHCACDDISVHESLLEAVSQTLEQRGTEICVYWLSQAPSSLESSLALLRTQYGHSFAVHSKIFEREFVLSGADFLLAVSDSIFETVQWESFAEGTPLVAAMQTQSTAMDQLVDFRMNKQLGNCLFVRERSTSAFKAQIDEAVTLLRSNGDYAVLRSNCLASVRTVSEVVPDLLRLLASSDGRCRVTEDAALDIAPKIEADARDYYALKSARLVKFCWSSSSPFDPGEGSNTNDTSWTISKLAR